MHIIRFIPTKGKKMKDSTTITAPMGNGEYAAFEVVILCSMDDFFDQVGSIVSPQCVKDLEDMGQLRII